MEALIILGVGLLIDLLQYRFWMFPQLSFVEHLSKLQLNNVNKLVMDHLNINSLPNKFDQLKSLSIESWCFSYNWN